MTDEQKNQYNNLFRWYKHIQNIAEITEFLRHHQRLLVEDPEIKIPFLAEKKKSKKWFIHVYLIDLIWFLWINFLTVIFLNGSNYFQMKNYAPEYFRSLHPVQNYYSNMPSDSKQNAQIKRYLIYYTEFVPPRTSHWCHLWSNRLTKISLRKTQWKRKTRKNKYSLNLESL